MMKKAIIVLAVLTLVFIAYLLARPVLEKKAAQKAGRALAGIASFDSLSFKEGAVLVKSFSAGSLIKAGQVTLRPAYLKMVSPKGKKPLSLKLMNVSAAGTSLGNGAGNIELSGDTVSFDVLMEKHGLHLSGQTVGKRKNALAGKGRLVSDSLKAGKVLLTGLGADFILAGKKVTVPSVAFNVFGGKAKGSGSLGFAPGNITYEMDMEYTGLDLDRLPAGKGIRFNGRFNGTMRIKGTARTLDEMIERLTGMEELAP